MEDLVTCSCGHQTTVQDDKAGGAPTCASCGKVLTSAVPFDGGVGTPSVSQQTTVQSAASVQRPAYPATDPVSPYYELATLSDRFLGALLDTLILMAVAVGLAFVGGFILGLIPFIGLLLAPIFGFGWGLAVSFFFYVATEGKSGQTIGKKMMKTKVVQTDGSALTPSRATTRWLGRMVNGLTFGIGFLMILWDPKRQTLHDKIGGTLVVRE